MRSRDPKGDTHGNVEAGYVLGLSSDPERLRAPDVSYVRQANIERLGGKEIQRFMRGARDLAVEMVSLHGPPSLEQRIRDYLEAGEEHF